MCRQRLSGWCDSVACRQSPAVVLTLWLSASCQYLAGCTPKASSSALSKITSVALTAILNAPSVPGNKLPFQCVASGK